MDWGQIWNSIKTFFTSNGLKILTFIGVLILGIIIIKIVMNITRRLLGKTKMEKIAQQFLLGAIKIVLYLVLVLILLSLVGIQVTGIITALSAILLAVGMALESNIANLANGIVIVATHMFKKGDYISVDGVEGSITNINFLFTTLMTPDNKKITLPNSTIVNSSVTNAGANKTRRVDFMFSVAYESDVETVKKIIIDVMMSNGNVRTDPAPFCRLKVLGASSIDFFANCWVDSEDYWDTYYYVIENVYNEFKRHDISVPYNQLEVRNRTDKVKMPFIKKALPARVEKVRKEEKTFDLETAGLSDFIKLSKHKTAEVDGNKKAKKEKVEEKKVEKKNAKDAKKTSKESKKSKLEEK